MWDEPGKDVDEDTRGVPIGCVTPAGRLSEEFDTC